MKVCEFKKINDTKNNPELITHDYIVDECFSGEKPDVPCTLLLGFNEIFDYFHVYTLPEDDKIHIAVYEIRNKMKKYVSASGFSIHELHPDHFIFPDETLYTFANMLLKHHQSLSFTNMKRDYNSATEDRPSLHGYVPSES